MDGGDECGSDRLASPARLSSKCARLWRRLSLVVHSVPSRSRVPTRNADGWFHLFPIKLNSKKNLSVQTLNSTSIASCRSQFVSCRWRKLAYVELPSRSA